MLRYVVSSFSFLAAWFNKETCGSGYAYAFDTHAAFELEGKERIPQGARYDLVH